MTPAEELAALRRLAELEAKAGARPRRDWKAANPAEYDSESPEYRARVTALPESKLEQAGMGILSAFSNVGRQGQRLAQKAIGDTEGVARTERAIAEQRAADEYFSKESDVFDVGRFSGDVAATAPAGGAAGRLVGGALTRLPGALKTLQSGGRLNSVLRLLTEGGTAGALTTGDAAEGALLAAGLGGTGAVTQRLLRGRKATPEAQKLLDAGVELTPGQMNPRGIYAQAENIATSLPAAGPLIRNAREQAKTQARVAAVKQIVPEAQGTTWDDALESAAAELDAGYAGLSQYPIRQLPGVKPGQPDPRVIRGIQNAIDDPGIRASPGARREVAGYATEQLQRLRGKPTVEDYQRLRSDFRAESRRLAKSQSDDDRAKGKLFDQADRVLTVQMNRALPLATRKELRVTDQKYARLRPYVQAEARGAGGVDGPSFEKMESAIKAGMTPNQVVRGSGRQRREFVNAARQTFNEARDPITGARMLGAPFALALSPVATFGAATPTGRALAAGKTGLQQGIRRVSDNDEFLAIINALRGGTAGALASQGEY